MIKIISKSWQTDDKIFWLAIALVCLYEFQSLLDVYLVQLLNYFSDWKNSDSCGINLEMYSVELDQLSRQFSEVCQLKEFSTEPKALIKACIFISALCD